MDEGRRADKGKRAAGVAGAKLDVAARRGRLCVPP